MVWSAKDLAKPEKGPTQYARWADKVPGVSFVAGRLPNWPRWMRILTGVVLLGIVVWVGNWLLNYFWGS